MLFLVTGESKGMLPFGPKESLELVASEWEAVVSYEQQGKVLAAGAYAGRHGGCVIFDVDSVEELHALVCQLPMFAFAEFDVVPLIGAQQALEGIRMALDSLEEPNR